MTNENGMTSVAIEYPEEATAADVDAFHAESPAQREADLQKVMEGERHMQGGQHDLQPRGITSSSFEQDEAALVRASEFQNQNYPQPQAATFVQDPIQGPQVGPVVEQDFQKLYGNSENEKGDLRRALNEQVELNNRLISETNQMRYVQPQQPVYAPQPTQGVSFNPHSPVNQAPQPIAPAPNARLLEKDAGEFVTGEDLDQVYNTGFAPRMQNMQDQIAYLASTLQKNQIDNLNQQKAQNGITPQIEFQLIQENGWLRNIPDPGSYLNALVDLNKQKQTAALAQRQGGAVQAAVQVQAQAGVPQVNPAIQEVARRVTYVERGGNQGMSPTGPASRQTQFAQLWQATLALPVQGGERGKAQRALLTGAGVQEVSGFRDPAVSTR